MIHNYPFTPMHMLNIYIQKGIIIMFVFDFDPPVIHSQNVHVKETLSRRVLDHKLDR